MYNFFFFSNWFRPKKINIIVINYPLHFQNRVEKLGDKNALNYF